MGNSFTAGAVYHGELRMGNIMCFYPILTFQFGRLSSPAVGLKELRLDWVDQPEGKDGAKDTMSGTDQDA